MTSSEIVASSLGTKTSDDIRGRISSACHHILIAKREDGQKRQRFRRLLG
ncbi:hypothetical protein [Microvirga ossetica]